MKARQLLDEFKAEFARRKFVGGLFPAFIRFFRSLGALGGKYRSLDDLFRDFPQQLQTSQGRTANTLIVAMRKDAGTTSLRPFYNELERFFRAEHKRFDYPNCAPHATQAWRDYIGWIEAILQLSEKEAARTEQESIEFVLETLKSHDVDTEGLQPLEQRFTDLLGQFDLAARKGEPNGAAFQGIVYAYIRADAPHLHLDVAKVGAGSKRLQRVGDIDGWEGERLVLSVEVKSFALAAKDVPDLAAFANAVAKRKAMGTVAALEFSSEARTDLEGMSLKTLDRDDLARLVELWDPLKQRAAINALAYYVHHIEKNSALISRLTPFLKVS